MSLGLAFNSLLPTPESGSLAPLQPLSHHSSLTCSNLSKIVTCFLLPGLCISTALCLCGLSPPPAPPPPPNLQLRCTFLQAAFWDFAVTLPPCSPSSTLHGRLASHPNRGTAGKCSCVTWTKSFHFHSVLWFSHLSSEDDNGTYSIASLYSLNKIHKVLSPVPQREAALSKC